MADRLAADVRRNRQAFWSRSQPHDLADLAVVHLVLVHAHGFEHPRGDAIALTQHSQQNMLCANIIVSCITIASATLRAYPWTDLWVDVSNLEQQLTETSAVNTVPAAACS